MSFVDGGYKLEETQRLEFKDAGGGLPSDIWESYSAFANTEGGEIVLGVHEDKASHAFIPIGVTNPASLINDYWNTVRNPTKVNHDVTLSDGVRVVNRDGHDFVVIAVPRAERDDKPVAIYDRKAKKFVAWVRRGAGDYRASDEDLKLMAYDSAPSADRQPLERFEIEDLCDETIDRYRKRFESNRPSSPWNTESLQDFLYHIGALAKGHDGRMHPTLAGLLSFGHEYEIANCLPRYLLDYRDESKDRNRWDDRLVSTESDMWSGNLVDFYLTVTRKLQQHFPTPFSTDEFGTNHGSRNPITEAVNEAVTNALVHAYYGDSATIRVILKHDRLDITNPGSLLVDKEVAIAGGTSEARNPTLMNIFNFIGAGDRAGSGLNSMWRTWGNYYGNDPDLIELHSPASIRLVLPTHSLANVATPPRTGEHREMTREWLLDQLGSHRQGITAREVSHMTGASERSAQRALKSLYEEGESASGQPTRQVKRKKQGRTWIYFMGEQ